MNACEVLDGLRPGKSPAVQATALNELARILGVIARKRRVPPQDHEDVAQEVAEVVWNRQQGPEPFRDEGSRRCWSLLDTILGNKYLDKLDADRRSRLEPPARRA